MLLTLRKVAKMISSEPSSFSSEESQRDDPLHGLLLDPHHVRADIRILTYAFKGKGPPAHHIEEIWHRLMLHLRTDAVREIDPESGMMIINDRQGAEVSLKAAGVLHKFVKLFVDDEHAAQGMLKKKQAGDTTVNIGMVGNMSLGQEPLTPQDAKAQAQAILERVKARMKPPEPAPIVVQNKLESKLDDLEEL
jgi:hypothetical protein